ncbi:MAG: hypothetical protein CM1200mP20_12170 [Pseudomonadota bacterium]|nr:MAG: hypothetical protein CM1200mP20_12170 [Pseudomonadota bacterium]
MSDQPLAPLSINTCRTSPGGEVPVDRNAVGSQVLGAVSTSKKGISFLSSNAMASPR